MVSLSKIPDEITMGQHSVVSSSFCALKGEKRGNCEGNYKKKKRRRKDREMFPFVSPGGKPAYTAGSYRTYGSAALRTSAAI